MAEHDSAVRECDEAGILRRLERAAQAESLECGRDARLVAEVVGGCDDEREARAFAESERASRERRLHRRPDADRIGERARTSELVGSKSARELHQSEWVAVRPCGYLGCDLTVRHAIAQELQG